MCINAYSIFYLHDFNRALSIIGAILVSLFFLFMVCKLIKQIWTDNYPGANKKGIKYKIINTLLFFLLVALIIMCSYHSGESGYNYSDYFIDRIP